MPELEGRSLLLISGTDVTERSLGQEEQAALRRVAVAVAEGHRPDESFPARDEEIAELLGAQTANLMRIARERP